jgi:DNA-binding CsgD family transcriptional regulator
MGGVDGYVSPKDRTASWQSRARPAPSRPLLDCMADRMAASMAMLDHSGRVLFVSRSLRRLLDRVPSVRIESGQLVLQSPRRVISGSWLLAQARARQDESRRSTVDGSAVIVATGYRDHTVPLFIEAQALPSEGLDAESKGDDTWVAFFYVFGEGRTLSERALRDLIGLTPCETALVKQLFGGSALTEAAVALGVTHETARKHLSSIFRKCEVRSQAQLQQWLANGPFFRREV